MRLWTIHPRHLDAKGLVALWREALLAQKVLQGQTRGYKRHPQLARFLAVRNPAAAAATYLAAIHKEACRRGYSFDVGKIGSIRFRGKITETNGQLLYEWRHFCQKLRSRDPMTLKLCRKITMPESHPLFRIVDGEVREWEKVQVGN